MKHNHFCVTGTSVRVISFLCKMKYRVKKSFFYNYEHLRVDRPILVHFIQIHKFSTQYFILHENEITRIKMPVRKKSLGVQWPKTQTKKFLSQKILNV